MNFESNHTTGRVEPDFDLMVSVMRRIFRPVARMLVGRVPCSMVIQSWREVFIEEARIRIERENRGPVTTKKLAAMTGEPLERVESITEDQESPDMTDGHDGRAYRMDERAWVEEHTDLSGPIESNILERWCDDPQFQDASGKPRVLPVKGDGISFEKLASLVARTKVSEEKLLERLKRYGNVEMTEDGRLRLLNRWYVARDEGDQRVDPNRWATLQSSSRALGRLARTAVHNLEADDKDRMLQRDWWSYRIRREEVAELRRQCVVATERHMAEIQQIVNTFEAGFSEPDTVVFGVGWYHWFLDPRGIRSTFN